MLLLAGLKFRFCFVCLCFLLVYPESAANSRPALCGQAEIPWVNNLIELITLVSNLFQFIESINFYFSKISN
jgi:hypothetical protein